LIQVPRIINRSQHDVTSFELYSMRLVNKPFLPGESIRADATRSSQRDNHKGETGMGVVRVLSRRGDDHITWDEQKLPMNDPETMAAVREAEKIFAATRAKGATAFRIDEGKPVQRIDQFDPTAQQILMVPRVVGG